MTKNVVNKHLYLELLENNIIRGIQSEWSMTVVKGETLRGGLLTSSFWQRRVWLSGEINVGLNLLEITEQTELENWKN